jgi:hypothetical protein
MATNDFLVFSGDPAANVMAQNDYSDAGFTTRLLGFTRGTAISLHMNKVWRQGTLMGSVLAKLTVDETGSDMLDDATTAGVAALQANLRAMITRVAQGAVGTGYLPLSGGILTGPLVAPQVSLNAVAGQPTVLGFNTGAGQYRYIQANTSNLGRWQIHLANNEPESGANTGSNFGIARFGDSGAYIDSPITINRSNGVVSFAHEPNIGGIGFPYLRLTGGALSGTLAVAGAGVSYSGITNGGHGFGLGWDGNIQAYVDGTYIGALATQGYVSGRVGGYLPLSGGSISGDLAVNGRTWLGYAGSSSTFYFGNDGSFANFRDANYKYRQWEGNWYDLWRVSDGMRVWSAGGNGWVMTMDGGGSLTMQGYLRCNLGRIISQSPGGAATLSMWTQSQGRCDGFWSDSGIYFGQMDGSGNPQAGWVQFQPGYSSFFGGIGTSANNSINSGASVNARDNLVAAGGWVYASNNVGGAIMTHVGIMYRALGNQNIALRWDGSKFFAWIDGGEIHLIHGEQGGNDRVNRMGISGNTVYCSDNDGSVWYLNTYRSDARLKRNITLADDFDSLSAIYRTPIRAFEWRTADVPPVAHGFVSSDLRLTLPDTVEAKPSGDEMGELDHIEILPMLAHVFRAIRQIADEVNDIRHKLETQHG